MSVIETSNLTKYYGDTRGIEDLDFSIEEGEVFGFLGPNGAGKTTTIRTILGFLKPTRGSFSLFNEDITNEKELIEAKKRIGFLPGEYNFYERTTGKKVLDLLEKLRGGSERDKLEEIFSPPLDKEIGDYSHGNKQKLGIIQAMMHEPDLVILDEPTQGLDPLMQKKFNELIQEKNEKQNVTVFFSSHILSEVRKICDRVGIIKNGELISVEEIDDLMKKSGKIVTAELKEEVNMNDFNLPDTRVVEEKPLKLVVTDGLNDLVNALSAYEIKDLSIREARLEDVFMHFYEE